MYTLQWTAGSLADPDILRRVFHSKQVPPAASTAGYFSDPRVDALLDEAAASTDEARRLELFQEVQRLLAAEVPVYQPLEQDELRRRPALAARRSRLSPAAPICSS